MNDQPAPIPKQPAHAVPRTVPVERTELLGGTRGTGAKGVERETGRPPRVRLFDREILGWFVFAVILVVAALAAWGTYIVLRQ